MEEWVPRDAGASYRWEPALGGFRKPQPGSLNVALRHPAFRGYADYMQTQAFQKALDTLLHEANEAQIGHSVFGIAVVAMPPATDR